MGYPNYMGFKAACAALQQYLELRAGCEGACERRTSPNVRLRLAHAPLCNHVTYLIFPRRRAKWFAALAMVGWLALAAESRAQVRPYIGFIYPAGGQQGTTFQVKLGGQGLDGVNRVLVTGPGVTGQLVEYDRPLNPQEVTLLYEQLKEFKRAKPEAASTMMSDSVMMTAGTAAEKAGTASAACEESLTNLVARIKKRVAGYVPRPASAALSAIAYVEITIAPNAPPGDRELRLATLRGVSNPLVFQVGQLPEVSRKPMDTAPLQVLGKEELALRKRPADEVEQRVTLPCTLNGQIASGELNRYRFPARKGQRLVITTQARSLVPYIADAVPGWFQPVLALYDASGKEVAYDDDYRFKPDPTILYRVPTDGDYALVIYDAIYRGREDFVYRITLGEVPFVTSIFPLGGRAGALPAIGMKGWNLDAAELAPPGKDAEPGIYRLTASRQRLVSNPLPFAVDALPETFEKEPNDTPARAQKVRLPVIINGRMDRPGDWDVFRFTGKANETIVAEVAARRLDSPLDSVLKLTDARGRLLAINDDHEDLAAGINTHPADSYLMAKLPADGTYYVLIGDTALHGGEEYGYRLRLSAPRPGFALRVVPSSVSLRSKGSAPLSVYVIRQDGFTGPIRLGLKNPPVGFSALPVSLTGTQAMARLIVRTSLVTTEDPLSLTVVGTANIHGEQVTHEAVPAEDRMQAFLWRHLVPATELKVLVFDPAYEPAPKRVPPAPASAAAEPKPPAASADNAATKPKFTKQQVAGRLRQLKLLFEDGLLTDQFYADKVAECDAVR